MAAPSGQTDDDDDPSSLYSATYDPVIHLNQVFPDPSSLKSIPSVQLYLSNQLSLLDAQIDSGTEEHQKQRQETQERINELQLELEDLFKNVEGVKGKAEKANAAMGDMTGGIRRLDGAKRNLTSSMTVLKQLQMLSMHLSFRTNVDT